MLAIVCFKLQASRFRTLAVFRYKMGCHPPAGCHPPRTLVLGQMYLLLTACDLRGQDEGLQSLMSAVPHVHSQWVMNDMMFFVDCFPLVTFLKTGALFHNEQSAGPALFHMCHQ